mmetsp:Transcript_79750/g.221973  ORF Transcript_79750/g.221973 Transcript_79750/m.221973 type:complete len:212 (-) Transcript_79750:605-1240(-)
MCEDMPDMMITEKKYSITRHKTIAKINAFKEPTRENTIMRSSRKAPIIITTCVARNAVRAYNVFVIPDMRKSYRMGMLDKNVCPSRKTAHTTVTPATNKSNKLRAFRGPFKTTPRSAPTRNNISTPNDEAKNARPHSTIIESTSVMLHVARSALCTMSSQETPMKIKFNTIIVPNTIKNIFDDTSVRQIFTYEHESSSSLATIGNGSTKAA